MNIRTLVGAALMGVTLSGCVETTTTTYVTDNYNREVRIINQSGRTVYRFYGSNVGTNSWEEDILGANVLPSGNSVMIDFFDGTGHCMFDFRIEFADGRVAEDYNINVCSVSNYYIR